MTDNFTCPVDGTRCESELCSFGCEQQRENTPTLRAALTPPAADTDELRRLMAERDHWKGEYSRLRRALGFIAKEQSATTATEAADKFQGIARAALGEQP